MTTILHHITQQETETSIKTQKPQEHNTRQTRKPKTPDSKSEHYPRKLQTGIQTREAYNELDARVIGAPEDLMVEDHEVATDDITIVLHILPNALRILDSEKKRLSLADDR